MASGNAILAGILGGLGGAGQAIGGGFAQAQRDELEREKLAQERDLRQQVIDQQQAQFEATQARAAALDNPDLAPLIKLGILPADTPTMNKTALEEALKYRAVESKRLEEEGRLNTARSAILNQPARADQPMPAEGAMYSEAETLPGKATTPKNAFLAAILGTPNADAILKSVYPDDEKKVIPVPDSGQFWDPSTRTWLTAPGSGATATAPPDVPGMRVVASVDKNGRTTYKQEPISVGTDREGLAIDRGYGSFAQAPQPVQQEINRYLEETSLRRSRAQGADAAGTKPLTEADVKDIGSATATLSAINQARGFSPQEMTAYLGLLNRPMAEAKQILAGMGIGDADARYNEFKAINGRLKAGMFLTAGKALTPMEEKVTSAFIVTGDERNVSEYLAKMNMYEAYTRAQRETQLQMARTPRSQADLEEYDTRLTENLRRAGMNTSSAQPAQGGATPRLGEPGYTGRVTQPDMPTAPPKPGRVWIKAPDGQWGQWDARKPIPQGYMR